MKPDNSIAFFQYLKATTEAEWETIDPNTPFGPLVAKGSKWKPGLTEDQLQAFETEMGFTFPAPLRNFYRTMNGLDKPYTYITENNTLHTRHWYYSYPESLEKIHAYIRWVQESSDITPDIIKARGISRIFPIWGHRFIMIDEPGHPTLSMNGSDIIFLAPTLSQACMIDILNYPWLSQKHKAIKFWNPSWRRYRRKIYRKIKPGVLALYPIMPRRIRDRGILTSLFKKKKEQVTLHSRARG